MHTELSGSHTKDRNLQLHKNILDCAPDFKVGTDTAAIWSNLGEQHQEGWQQERMFKKVMFSDIFESKLADLQNMSYKIVTC